jgi:transposase
MRTNLRYVAFDVHADTIAVAVAEPSGEVRSVGVIPNRAEAVTKLVRKLGQRESLRVCYEAGPTGFVLYWQLAKLEIACEVIAPSLVPTKAGDRVKTDRRDALKLARCYRAGELTPVHVPDAAQEALRDLVRAREAAKQDQLRARHRLSKFLLRQGRSRPPGLATWKGRHHEWLTTLHFDEPAQQVAFLAYLHEVDHARDRVQHLETAIAGAITTAPPAMRAVIGALQTLRGVRDVVAVTVASEIGSLTRFAHPRLLMGYSGLVPQEHSSGSSIHRGGITKTGNAHLRRVMVEAAWAYRHGPSVTGHLRRRQHGQPPQITALAWQAQRRLCARYRHFVSRGKPTLQIITAIARELLGFIWAIGRAAEQRVAA